ncbi:hypothetical protein BGZ88_009137, partial [Linnemannia elongata]
LTMATRKPPRTFPILDPQECQSDERDQLARAERRSKKLERVSSIPGNNSTLRTLQNSSP